MRWHMLPIAISFCIAVSIAGAAGLQSIEVPAGAEGRNLTGAVWYPCAAPAQDVRMSELLVLRAVKDCAIKGSALPLVVLSHGRQGNYFLHRDLTAALADAGFVVAAITHPGDSSSDRSRTDELSVLVERPADMKRLIDFMLETWPGAAVIDRGRIGFFGFSRGAYTGLVAIGADPDFRAGFAFCAADPEPICRQVQEYDQTRTLAHDVRIKAAVLVDPALSRLFGAPQLSRVKVPIQVWGSALGGDGVSRERIDSIVNLLPSRPQYRVVANAQHFSFTSPCSPEQTKALPEICTDPPGFDRVAFHRTFNAAVIDFFRKHLRRPQNRAR